MKSKGPELGSLSSRFFAYVQLKKLDIVRTGEILAFAVCKNTMSNKH